MRPLTWILAICLIALSVSIFAAEKPEMKEAEIKKRCEADGGCVLVTNDALVEIVTKLQLYEQHIEQLQKELRKEKSKVCI